jgi:hypothetical protein
MSYSKAPTQDTHNTVRIPALGSPIAVSTRATNVAPQVNTLSFLDCYPRHEAKWGSDPVTRIKKRESWEGYTTGAAILGAGPICHSVVITEETNPSIYFGDTSTFYGTSVGSGGCFVVSAGVTGIGNATGTLAVDSTNTKKVVYLTTSNNLWTWNEAGTGVTTTNLAGIAVTGYRNIVFLNGYLFAATSTSRIYNSAPGGVLTTWNSTDYLSPEIFPDGIVWLDLHRNHLVAFGPNSIEFFYDGAVEVGSPLVRAETYTSRIGMVDTGTQRQVARINDDLYFIGRNNNNVRGLYRLRDFRVEEIQNDYVASVLNFIDPISGSNYIYAVDLIIINGEPQILISMAQTYDLVYHPKENVWWMLRNRNDYNINKAVPEVNLDFPGAYERFGGCIFPSTGTYANQPLILARILDDTYTWTDNYLHIYTPDNLTTIASVQADIYTEVIDFGNNHYKKISRVDAIGDYGNNVLTLSYNGTPNYSQTYTACTPTRTPSSLGYGNNVSWYNLGAYRRISLKLKLVGSDVAFHEGFEIEYDVGAS